VISLREVSSSVTSRHPNATEEPLPSMESEFGEIRVLLVDDDRDFVTLASTLLETENERIETTTETSPVDALDRTDLGGFDCIVSDYRMPDMDGIEFLEAVHDEYPELPFILFTGKGGEKIAEQAIAAGVDDYIVKDGSPEQYAISANRIENLVMQYRTQQQSIRKHTLDTLTRGVLRTILNEPTREAIEQGVCDQLVTFELCSFAWIGERDPRTGAIQSRAWASENGDGFLDSVSFFPDAESPQSVEARALTAGERRIERGISSATESGEWQAEAATRGFETAAGFPIVYEGSPYGVLGVYTDREDACFPDEVEALDLIADLTAFSIGASKRRQGDTSRQIIEVEFAVDDTELPFVRLASTLGCTVRLTQTVHRSDGTKLTIYSLDDVSSDQLDEIGSILDPDVVRVSDSDGAETELAIASSDPWWADLTELYGANIGEGTADGEDATVSIELPPSADVRSVVALLEEQYPEAEPIARRERTRSERSIDEFRTLLGERLTDRQRDVVETAYHAGYYEWPHEASSEEVAELLGIAQPTFAEHFWTAQRRIAQFLLETEESDEHVQ
jgi:CheY-like chemotaxis protein